MSSGKMLVHWKSSPFILFSLREGLRDPRGFAVKFYTDHGNWDLVGNNMPVSINSFFLLFFFSTLLIF